MVPRRRNAYVTTNRRQKVSELRRRFRAKLSNRQAVIGLGGTGKTSLVVEYCFRYKEKYSNILWIDAEDEAAIRQSILKICSKIGNLRVDFEDALSCFIRWLEKSSNVLIVFDNADNYHKLLNCLPPDFSGHLIVTTRSNHVCESTGIHQPFKIGHLSTEDALSFILSRSDRKNADESEIAEAKSFVEMVEVLPLALEHAAAYVKRRRTQWHHYLIRFNQKRIELFGPIHGQSEPHDYRKFVTTTWELNFQAVSENVNTFRILGISAWLNNQDIPFIFFVSGAKNISNKTDFVGFLGNVENDPMELEDALEPLIQFSIIDVNADCRSFRIHRLVQEVFRKKLTEAERSTFLSAAVEVLAANLPTLDAANNDQLSRVLPHATALERVDFKSNTIQKLAGRIFQRMGTFAFNTWNIEIAGKFYKRAIEVRELSLGRTHLYTAESIWSQAILHSQLGLTEQATHGLLEALGVYRKEFPNGHISTIKILLNLHQIECFKNAAEPDPTFLREVIEFVDNNQDDESVEFARVLSTIASMLNDQEVSKAIRYYKEVLRILDVCELGDCVERINARTKLGGRYRIEGELHLARNILELECDKCLKTIGEEDPLTATALNFLGQTYLDCGLFYRAEKSFRHAFTLRKKYNPTNVFLLSECLNNLGLALQNQGRFDAAKKAFQEARAVLGESKGIGYEIVQANLHGLKSPGPKKTTASTAELFYQHESFEQLMGRLPNKVDLRLLGIRKCFTYAIRCALRLFCKMRRENQPQILNEEIKAILKIAYQETLIDPLTLSNDQISEKKQFFFEYDGSAKAKELTDSFSNTEWKGTFDAIGKIAKMTGTLWNCSKQDEPLPSWIKNKEFLSNKDAVRKFKKFSPHGENFIMWANEIARLSAEVIGERALRIAIIDAENLAKSELKIVSPDPKGILGPIFGGTLGMADRIVEDLLAG